MLPTADGNTHAAAVHDTDDESQMFLWDKMYMFVKKKKKSHRASGRKDQLVSISNPRRTFTCLQVHRSVGEEASSGHWTETLLSKFSLESK